MVESGKHSISVRSGMSRSVNAMLAALTIGMTTTMADGIQEDRPAGYNYTADEVNAAAGKDLDTALAPFKIAGKLNRNTREFERVEQLFARLIDVAMQWSDSARKLGWVVYVHDGRLAEAYSRAGGQIVISAGFLERYRPSDAELAFVIGHEVAHVICEHERIKLSAVWRRNAPQMLPARYAMEYLDTEPWVRAQVAPIVRLQERAADRLGLELAAAIGADPSSALRFFDKSVNEGHGGIFPDVHEFASRTKIAAATRCDAVSTAFRGVSPARGELCTLIGQLRVFERPRLALSEG